MRRFVPSLLIFCLSVTASAVPPEGRIEVYKDFHSPELGNSRNISVWLPSDYEADERLHFPVIYMHDGQNVFDPATSYSGVAWAVDKAVTRLATQEHVREAIVIAINNTADREKEYSVEQRGLLYGDFIVKTLKPFIDEKYRTQPAREATFLMGSSMGAVISIELLWYYPQVFSAAAGLSLPALYGDSGSLFRTLGRHAVPSQPVRIYFDHGTVGEDATYRKDDSRLARWLMARGLPAEDLDYRVFPGGDHNEASWSARLQYPLRFLLGN